MAASFNVFSWVIYKAAYVALLVGLGLIGVSLFTFLREPGDFFAQQHQATQSLKAEELRLRAAIAEADLRMREIRTQVAARELRADQAAKVARELDDLNGGLSRFSSSSAQLEENEARSVRMKQMEADSRKLIGELGQNLIRVQWEKDGIEIALEKNQTQLKTAVTETSPLLHYLRLAWDSQGRTVLAVAVLLMMAPSIWKLARAK